MRNRVNQVYERYWNYTAAFTDFNGSKFVATLKACLDYIDAHLGEEYSSDKYSSLQIYLNGIEYCEDLASQRKRINQLVKLGFIKPYLAGYPSESRDYVNAATDRKRKNILSKIVYKYANLCNSTTHDINSQQLAFFLKSLEEIGSFDEISLATLMTIDITTFPKDYATKEDLESQYAEVDIEGFMERKYNQVGHLKNLLSKLDDLVLHDNVLYFQTDALRLFGDNVEEKRIVRDPYLQRVYKNELEEESVSHYDSLQPKCMLDGLSHPVLIASHIKPYKYSDETEAFDVNNGLLLSKSLDSLFDLGYITFNSDGSILPSRDLCPDVVEYVTQFSLHENLINPKRMEYMEYHREHVFQKRYSLAIRR